MVLKKYFFAGCAILFPFFISIYVAVMLFVFLDNAAGRFINSFLLSNYGFKIPGLGLILMLGLIFTTGFLSSRILVRRFIPWIEGLLVRIPFLKTIYQPSKELSQYMFGTGRKNIFKKVVFVEYTENSHTLGFITNESLIEIEGASSFISVFVPFAPTPFSGIVLFFAKEKIRMLDTSVDQALKCIISGGIISPFNKK